MKKTVLTVLLAALLVAPVAARAAGEIFETSDDEGAARTPGIEEYDMIGPGLMVAPDGSEKAQGDVTATGEKKDRVLSIEEIRRLHREGKYEKIVSSLDKLVQAKDAAAAEILGIMYKEGQGVIKDEKKAISLLGRAADANRALAQHHMAFMYYAGQGVEKDLTRALMWMNIAMVHDTEGADKARARQDRDNLSAMLPRPERDRALELAKAWLDKKGEAHLLSFQ